MYLICLTRFWASNSSESKIARRVGVVNIVHLGRIEALAESYLGMGRYLRGVEVESMETIKGGVVIRLDTFVPISGRIIFELGRNKGPPSPIGSHIAVSHESGSTRIDPIEPVIGLAGCLPGRAGRHSTLDRSGPDPDGPSVRFISR